MLDLCRMTHLALCTSKGIMNEWPWRLEDISHSMPSNVCSATKTNSMSALWVLSHKLAKLALQDIGTNNFEVSILTQTPTKFEEYWICLESLSSSLTAVLPLTEFRYHWISLAVKSLCCCLIAPLPLIGWDTTLKLEGTLTNLLQQQEADKKWAWKVSAHLRFFSHIYTHTLYLENHAKLLFVDRNKLL